MLIMILINEISTKIQFHDNFNVNSSEIIIKINKTGINGILNNIYINIEYPCPSLIYLNNEIQNETNRSKININKSESIVKLIWNAPLKSIRFLFCNCSNITEIFFLNFDTSKLTDMSHLFENCYSLTSVNISNLNIKNITSMDSIFYNCINLTSIDLSNFDTSKVTNMDKLFYNCKSLKYINLINFTNKKNPSTIDMLYGVPRNSKIYIDKNKAPYIYNLINNMSYIINLRKLDYLDNSLLDTINVKTTLLEESSSYDFNFSDYEGNQERNVSFYKRNSIVDDTFTLSNKITTEYNFLDNETNYKSTKNILEDTNVQNKINETEDFFINFSSEINKYEYRDKSFDNFSDIITTTTLDDKFFSDKEELIYSTFSPEKSIECYISCEICNEEGNYTKHNCLSCSADYPYELNIDETINCYNICDYYSYYNSNNNKSYCTSDLSCPKVFNKLIPLKNQCIDECSKDEYYQYEFRKECYQECPYNISEKSKIKDFYCEATCPKEYPFEIVETQDCVNNCSIIQRARNLCIINFLSEDNENNKEVEEKSVENIKDELINDFDTSDIDKGINIVIEQKESTVTISSAENQKNAKKSNSTSIDLGECEKKIKDEYGIPEDKSLYILKIDVKQEGLKIPKIAYEVYYPLFGDKLIQLNLTACKDTKIELSLPVILTEDIDIINPKSEYYNDICYTFTSEDGTDVSLSDRKQNFVNNNLTVCEDDCNFNEYIDGKVFCSCKVKTNSTTKIRDNIIERNKLFNSFTNFKNIANIKVLKCYKLIFNLDEYKHNYANVILLVIFLFFLITFFIFYCKDYHYLEKILNMIVYFHLHLNLVTKFLNRIKREEQIKLKNFKKIVVVKNTKIENKKNKFKNMKYPAPLYLKHLILAKKINMGKENIRNMNIYGESKKALGNPIKKNNKNIKINKNIENPDIFSSKKEILSKNDIAKNKSNNFFNKNNYPHNMNENQMYKMFLSIYNKSDFELNQIDYKSAIKIDKRTFFEYYLSLLRTKYLIFFSFWPIFDYNSQILKIFLFFFNFSLSFIVNALFFNDNTMHKIYEEKGSFNLIYNIPQILCSSLISEFLKGIIQELALTDYNLISLKQNKNNKNITIKKQKTRKIIKIKIISFFIVTLLLLIFFWFYLACFCAVYKNTQIHLIKDTLISFGISMITPLGIYIFPGIFRLCALKSRKKNKILTFKFSKLLQFLC